MIRNNIVFLTVLTVIWLVGAPLIQYFFVATPIGIASSICFNNIACDPKTGSLIILYVLTLPFVFVTGIRLRRLWRSF